MVSKLQYYLPLFGSSEHLLRAFKRNPYLLSSDLEGVVKPNVAYLHECGLGACDIAKLCISRPGLLVINPERFQDMVAYAENIGVPCGSGMFSHALHAVACFSKEEIAARVDYLKNTFMWTDAEVGIAVSKAPLILTRSKESLQRRSEFLISKSRSARRYSSRSSYALIRMLHRISLKIMQQLAEGRFQLDSVLHEPRLIRKLVCSLCHSVEKKPSHCCEMAISVLNAILNQYFHERMVSFWP
ncbi:uncharacterized protein [Triticum aestivum]|uniref:uncharacterized protein isoform X2 n=1 Tax=Triticum aestivum TaxID=4565 RepID=UPI001D014807|nr:uncharacterized protein LOC123131640 isoform X2 [Triticum aestivum]